MGSNSAGTFDRLDYCVRYNGKEWEPFQDEPRQYQWEERVPGMLG